MNILLTFVLLLAMAKLGGELVEHLRYPSILGELAGGIILGPSVLGVIDVSGAVESVGYIGILLLMFLAGAETNLEDLSRTGKTAVVVAMFGVIVPFVFGASLAMAYGYTVIVSLFVGATLAATSVGITVRVLLDAGRLNTPVGLTILGAAVMDDIIAVLVLTILAGVASASRIGAFQVARILLLMAGFFILAAIIGRVVVGKVILLTHMLKTEDAVESLAIIFILLLSLLAEEMYVAGITGSFVAGLIIARTPEKDHVVMNTKVIGYAFFIPLFFAMVGARADIRAVGAVGLFGVALVAVAVGGKVVASYAACRCRKVCRRDAFAIGIGMTPRMEVALVIANTGLVSGIIGTDLYAAVILMAFATTLVTPPLLKKALAT